MQNSVVSDIAQTPPHEPNLPIEASFIGNMNYSPSTRLGSPKAGGGDIHSNAIGLHPAYPLYG